MQQLKDLVGSTIVGGISDSDTSVTLADAGDFPDPQYGLYWARIWDDYYANPALDSNTEEVLCTAKSGNVLTIVRGLHDTAYAHNTGGRTYNVEIMAGAGNILGLEARMFGAVGDGVTDDSGALQSLLDYASSSKIPCLIPKGTYMTDALDVGDDTKIVMEPGTVLSANSGYATDGWGNVLTIRDVSNVTILGYGAEVTMAGQYTSGEARSCISIRGATNVVVKTVICSGAGGDGIIISHDPSATAYSENVYIKGCTCSENRRNGISIISAINCKIEFCNLVDQGQGAAGGTAPCTGLQIEPDASTQRLEGIRVVDCRSSGNIWESGTTFGTGFACRYSSFDDGNPVDIEFRGCWDYQSVIGFEAESFDSATKKSVGGSQRWIDCTSIEAEKAGFRVMEYRPDLAPIFFIRPTVVDCNTDDDSNLHDAAAISLFRRTGVSGTHQMGNVHIFDPTVIDTRASRLIDVAIYIYDPKEDDADHWEQVTVRNLRVESQDTWDPIDWVNFGGAGDYDDPARLLKWSSTGSFSISYNNYVRYVDDANLAAACTITLANAMAVGSPPITVEIVDGTYAFTLQAGSGSKIVLPSGDEVDTIASNRIGDRITVQKLSTDNWHVTEIVGFDGDSGSTLTISSGNLTLPQSAQRVHHYLVETEGGASTDNLVDIVGGKTGDIVFLTPADAAHDVVIVNSGNIEVSASFTMDGLEDCTGLLKRSSSTWCAFSTMDNS